MRRCLALAATLHLCFAHAAQAQDDFFPAPLNPEYSFVAPRPSGAEEDAAGSIVRTLASADWQSVLIGGVADFVERRGKATAMAFGIERARNALCDSSDSLTRGTLAATCSVLTTADPFVVPVGWTSLQAAFRSDISALPITFPKAQLAGDASAPAVLLVRAARAIVLLERGAPLAQVMKGLSQSLPPTNDIAFEIVRDWALALEFIAQLDASPHPSWPSAVAAELARLRGVQLDPVQQEAVARQLVQLREGLLWTDSLSRLAGAAVRAAAASDTATNRPARLYSSFLAAAVDLFARAPQLGLRPIDPAGMRELERARAAVRHIEMAFSAVRAREYGNTVVQTFAAISMALDRWTPPAGVSRYITFAADLAQAGTEEGVSQVLERFALPPGSYAAKRKGSMLGVNAYLGGQYSRECTTVERCSVSISDGAAAGGVWAPIGIEASTNLGGFALGVFGSILDLGAVLTAREEDSVASDDGETADSIASAPRIGLKQVVAPGLFLTVGIRGVPFTIGVGVSVVPELRTRTGESGDRAVSVRRLSIFGAVDLPVFRLR